MPEEKLIRNPEQIRLNANDEIQQILGNPPGWLLRWGIGIIFLSVIVFFALAWFIKYPDIVSADAILTTENPPIRVVGLSNGEIEKLLVQDMQYVDENTLLIILEDPASHEDVLKLEQELAAIPDEEIATLAKLKLPGELSIGVLQNSYASLLQKISDLKFYINTNIVFKKKSGLENQIEHTKALNTSLQKQVDKLGEELVILKLKWDREIEMKGNDIGTELAVESAKMNYLQLERQMENLRSNVNNNNIRTSQLKVQILELEKGNQDAFSSKKLAISKDILNLKTEIKTWKQSFLITAPIAGRIAMSKIWSENQFVKTGEEVMTIVPESESGKIICKAKLLPNGAGKVKAGMEVNIQLNGFPYQEYGVIKAKVNRIALVPEQERGSEHYITEIELSDSLKTTYNKKITFRQEMKAVAQIVTEERTIFDRIFDKILDVIYNR